MPCIFFVKNAMHFHHKKIEMQNNHNKMQTMEFFAASKAKRSHMEDAMQYSDCIAVIADGHCRDGSRGADIAQFTVTSLMRVLNGLHLNTFNPELFEEFMTITFRTIHDEYLEIMKDSGIEVHNGIPMKDGIYITGGTTATTAVFGSYNDRPYVMTANVGDSDGFIFSKKDGVYCWKQLTTTHEPTSESEYRRIQQKRELAPSFIYETKGAMSIAGSLPIFDADANLIHYEDTYAQVQNARKKYNELRKAFTDAKQAGLPTAAAIKMEALAAHEHVLAATSRHEHSDDGRRFVSTVRGDRSCYIAAQSKNYRNDFRLSMTRVIGDYPASLMGVTPEPSVLLTWLDEEDLGDQAVLFIATDGVLDCYEMEELAQLVLESDRNTLIDKFHAKAQVVFADEYDDMTFIMTKLK